MSDQHFPMLGYEYDKRGYHGDPVVIENSEQLNRFMQRVVAIALIENREIRITDRTGDDMLLQIEGGRVKWAGGGDIAECESVLRIFANQQKEGEKANECCT